MAIAYVQSSTIGNGNGVNNYATGAIAVSAGNLLVVNVSVALGSSVSSLVDTAGNTFTLMTSATSNGKQMFQYAAENCLGNAANVATVTLGGSEIGSIQQHEFSGIATASAKDKTTTGTESSSTTHATGTTGALSQADEVVVVGGMGAFGSAGAPSNTDGAYTLISAANGANNEKFITAYQIVSATTAVTYNGWSSTSVGEASTVLVTYKGAAAASGVGRLVGGALAGTLVGGSLAG